MKITVVTVAYNAARTIGDTVASVAAQRGVEFEHLILDGASTDDTAAVVAALDHPRLRFVSEPDRGIYDAMNKGFDRARGDLVGFLNADDFFCRTDALALLAAAAQRSDKPAVSAAIAVVRADHPRRAVRAYPAHGFRPWTMHLGNQPPHPGFYARREAVARVGRFDADMKVAADFDWLMRFHLLEGLRAEPVRETLVAQREGGVSQRLGGINTARRESFEALRRRGLFTSRALILAKYPLKAAQLVGRPHQFPPPAGVAWFPQ